MKTAILVGLFASTVVVANWLIATIGLVPVGFGLRAPAGVYAAGLALVVRDSLQDAAGRRWTLAAIALGAALSVIISPAQIALASGFAFAASELADFAVYSPIRRKSWLAAALASNTVGLAVDSALFLWLAFNSLAFLPGQIVGKLWATLAAVAVLSCVPLAQRMPR